jgi:hypothetical protein
VTLNTCWRAPDAKPVRASANLITKVDQFPRIFCVRYTRFAHVTGCVSADRQGQDSVRRCVSMSKDDVGIVVGYRIHGLCSLQYGSRMKSRCDKSIIIKFEPLIYMPLSSSCARIIADQLQTISYHHFNSLSVLRPLKSYAFHIINHTAGTRVIRRSRAHQLATVQSSQSRTFLGFHVHPSPLSC